MQPIADSDPPFFFRRLWTGNTALDEVMVQRRLPDGTLLIEPNVIGDEAPEGIEHISLLPESGALLIYGRKVTSSYAEDAAYVNSCEARGLIFTESFSVACVDGEIGTHPIATVTEISREQFEAARARGWESE